MSRSRRVSARGPERRRYFESSAMAVYVCKHCDKFTYASKKQAKKVIEVAHKGELMNVYRCRETNGLHIGHQARVVRAGLLTRQERYG